MIALQTMPIAFLSLFGSCAAPSRCCESSVADARVAASNRPHNLVVLDESLSALRECFNAERDKLRMVALFSPT